MIPIDISKVPQKTCPARNKKIPGTINQNPERIGLVGFFGDLIFVPRILLLELIRVNELIQGSHCEEHFVDYHFVSNPVCHREVTRFCYACHTFSLLQCIYYNTH